MWQKKREEKRGQARRTKEETESGVIGESLRD